MRPYGVVQASIVNTCMCVFVTARQWTKVASLVPSCQVIFTFHNPNGTNVSGAHLAYFFQFSTTWAQGTSTWTNTGGYTTVLFSVIAVCNTRTSLAPAEGFSLFFDDFSLKPL